MGKLIIRPKHGIATISGYGIDFPTQLNGVLTLKEWDMLITIINQNMIRTHVSIWLISPVLFIFFGLLFAIIILIVGIVRWESFKSKAEDDLKRVLLSLNSQLNVKGVSICYIRSQATFTLEITYPELLTKPIQMNIYPIYNFKPVLLETYAGSIPLVNPDIHRQPYHPCDARLRSLLIASKPTSLNYPGWVGYNTESFPYALYNYLTPQEYKAILNDYNNVLVSKMESSSWTFFIVSAVLCIFLIGLILIFPAIIWLMVSRNNYRREWDQKLNALNQKYTQLYAVRGLSFHFYSTRHDLPRGFLNIHAPLDCGAAPTFSIMVGKKQVISATVPNQLQPMYIHNGQQIPLPDQNNSINSGMVAHEDNSPNSGLTTDIDIDSDHHGKSINENTPLIG